MTVFKSMNYTVIKNTIITNILVCISSYVWAISWIKPEGDWWMVYLICDRHFWKLFIVYQGWAVTIVACLQKLLEEGGMLINSIKCWS